MSHRWNSASHALQSASRNLLITALFALLLILLLVPANPSKANRLDQRLIAPSATAPLLFQANLSGNEEVPSVNTSASGLAILALDSETSTLYYRVKVDHIQGITMAHIHLGAPGINGAVTLTLYNGSGDFDPDNPVSGSFILTAGQIADLQTGNYYVNVHTDNHPAGEIRGQIGSRPISNHYSALLTGSEEIPPVSTNAQGTAQLNTLNGETFNYEITVQDIVGITAAHIHLGAVEQNGPVIFTLYDGSGPFDPDNPIKGSLMINAQNLVDLLTGYYYVNVHTLTAPEGEIRGQVFTANRVHLPLVIH